MVPALSDRRSGYGFVAADVPELSIAVAPEARGRGFGTQLLGALVAAARDAGHRAISLSVEPENPALRLYERPGFRRVGNEGGAWTMALELRPP
jgi:ribosomal-protein-alanine N-acetyltransferase